MIVTRIGCIHLLIITGKEMAAAVRKEYKRKWTVDNSKIIFLPNSFHDHKFFRFLRRHSIIVNRDWCFWNTEKISCHWSFNVDFFCEICETLAKNSSNKSLVFQKKFMVSSRASFRFWDTRKLYFRGHHYLLLHIRNF